MAVRYVSFYLPVGISSPNRIYLDRVRNGGAVRILSLFLGRNPANQDTFPTYFSIASQPPPQLTPLNCPKSIQEIDPDTVQKVFLNCYDTPGKWYHIGKHTLQRKKNPFLILSTISRYSP